MGIYLTTYNCCHKLPVYCEEIKINFAFYEGFFAKRVSFYDFIILLCIAKVFTSGFTVITAGCDFARISVLRLSDKHKVSYVSA